MSWYERREVVASGKPYWGSKYSYNGVENLEGRLLLPKIICEKLNLISEKTEPNAYKFTKKVTGPKKYYGLYDVTDKVMEMDYQSAFEEGYFIANDCNQLLNRTVRGLPKVGVCLHGKWEVLYDVSRTKEYKFYR
jgi:5-formaminoimidazole-4-carboxamide-1-beta-D-ribofuranosyl 5'-monophosphate synthetase